MDRQTPNRKKSEKEREIVKRNPSATERSKSRLSKYQTLL
jgi:hypothetical protein